MANQNDQIIPKMSGESMDIVSDNIAKLKQLFPEIITENKIDFEVLKSLLGNEVEEAEERYSFTWHGKAQASRLAQTPSTGTLRPCPEESVDWETTQNLFIEGDNLEVLKLLQKSYHKQVKMIYIDPPYNTGKEFIYPDNFQENIDTYLEYTRQKDSEGRKFATNTETSGRYHTNWLNMMYPRLKLARNLLRDDGLIFISIDENEVTNLRKLCDEIFGEDNHIATIANVNNPKGRSDDKFIATAHESLILYAKNIDSSVTYGFEPEEHITRRYNKVDGELRYREIDLRKTGDNDRREDRPNLFYYFYYNETTGELFPSRDDKLIEGFTQIKPIKDTGDEGNWRWGFDNSRDNTSKLLARYMPNRKIWGVFEKDYLEGRSLVKPTSAWTFKEVNTERGSESFIELGFDKEVFPRPKPVGLICRVLNVATQHELGTEIVLDFFSGSCTTGHAVMTLNSEENSQRRFVMVQLPEYCDEKTVAYKSGYKTIADIGKERLRRVAKKIKGERPEYHGDLGFKVFKLDSSNFKPWDADFNSLAQDLAEATEVVKADRSSQDVLFEILLKYGLDLTLPIATHQLAGKTVYEVGAGALIVCLDDGVTEAVAEAIGKLKESLAPEVMRVVFKDSSFGNNDAAKVNAVQVLKQYGIDDVKSI